MDLPNKSIVNIEVIKDAQPSVIRWHPKRMTVAAVGFKDGRIAFVDVQSLQTYTMKIESAEDVDASSGVIDLGWDPGEDHLLVAFGDGSLIMIAYNGFDEKTELKFSYER